MENKKECEKTLQDAAEIADSELDQVSGGFLTKINSKLPPEDGSQDENEKKA